MRSPMKSIATGTIQNYEIKDKIFTSAYKKDTFVDFVEVNRRGIENDFQADKRFHGGIDKAIHIGSYKHFTEFQNIHNKPLDKLAIGCNIFIDSYDEKDIHIGDIYTIGNVEVQVTQPRQPCWKIGALFGKEVSRYITKYNATGWYVKVLNGGIINIADIMILQKRVSNISMHELSTYLKNPPKEDKKLIERILLMPYLAQSYKNDFSRLLTNG